MDNHKRDKMNDALKAMRTERLKIGFGEDMRVIVSNDLYQVMLSAQTAREDLNLGAVYGDEKWQGMPLNRDHRLAEAPIPFEFVKLWNARREASHIIERPLLSSATHELTPKGAVRKSPGMGGKEIVK